MWGRAVRGAPAPTAAARALRASAAAVSYCDAAQTTNSGTKNTIHYKKEHYELTRTGIADVIPENIDFKQKKNRTYTGYGEKP